MTNLATKTSLNAVENKIASVSNLVKKIDNNTKTNEIEEKITDHGHSNIYITPESFVARIKQVNLASKSDIANFVNKTDFDKLKNLNKKLTSNKTKNVLIKTELKKLQTFYSSFFIGQNYFNNDGAQLYLIFPLIYKTIATFSGPNIFSEWESKGLSDGKFRPPYTTNKFFSPKLQ